MGDAFDNPFKAAQMRRIICRYLYDGWPKNFVAYARIIRDALAPGSPSRPYLLGIVEQLAAQISIQNIKTPKMPKLEILN